MCLGFVSGYMYKVQKKKGRISLNSRSCKLLKLFAPFDTVVELPMQLGVEDTFAFRLNQFNLGAPVQWFREICNMCEVTHEKLQRLNRNPDLWNGNQIPTELFPSIYNIAAYNAQSRNPQDQEEQKILYIKLFEITKSYAEGQMDSLTFLDNQAFRHPNETHKMLEFLRAAHSPVSQSSGRWHLWYNADPLAPFARYVRKMNSPSEKQEQDSEMQVDFEVDTSQFAGLTTQQKLDTDLDELVEQDICNQRRDDDD